MAFYIGQLSLVPYTFVPKQWLPCAGEIEPIQRYTALYALLGYRFGKSGATGFGFPSLAGKAPLSELSYIICSDGFWPQGGLPPDESPPFVGELVLVPYEAQLEPAGWYSCDGRLLKIDSADRGLFSLLGNRYGGDGKTTFALPDLQKHVPQDGLRYLIANAGVFPNANYGGGNVYVGQLLLVPSSGALPLGFLRCDGGVANIEDNQALFALVGFQFGGNHTTTFGLPDLRGKAPVAGLHYLIAANGIFPEQP